MYGSQCLFTCYDGYTMVGSAKRVCKKDRTSSNGLWTGRDTRCAGMLSFTAEYSQFGCLRSNLNLHVVIATEKYF